MFIATSRSTRRNGARPAEAWRAAAMVIAAASLFAGARAASSVTELLLATGLLPATMLLAWRRAATAIVPARPVATKRVSARARP